MNKNIINEIAKELIIGEWQVIARYRKEATGALDEDIKKYMLNNNKKIDNNNSFLIED